MLVINNSKWVAGSKVVSAISLYIIYLKRLDKIMTQSQETKNKNLGAYNIQYSLRIINMRIYIIEYIIYNIQYTQVRN